MHSDLWVEEKYKEILGIRYKVNNVLFSGKSEFQTVDVVETSSHGKMLLNDGFVMITERDEFIYHDMITHVPMFTHKTPKNVLVIGGGDGGTAREVLRHKSVEKCTMVEIDKMVVDACREHIPQTSSIFNNSKLDLVIGDGLAFVKETTEKYDVIIVDSTDPIGPAGPLFDQEFYQDIYNCLSEDGIVVAQGESVFYEAEMQKKLMEILSTTFPVAQIYNYNNMTYPGGLWSFVMGSKKYHPIKDFNKDLVGSSGLDFQYYCPEIHQGAFALPHFMRENLKNLIKG